MLTYDFQYKDAHRNPSEKLGAFAEVIDREAEQYAIASIAVATGPIALGEAAINTYIHSLETLVNNEALYSPDFIKEFKAHMTETVEHLNSTLFSAGQRLHVHPIMSLTAVAVGPDGQASFCQAGNTIAILCNQEKTFLATQPMTNEKDLKKAGMSTFPIDRTTITALGINHMIFPKFTKTVLTEESNVFLLSSGFTIDMSRTMDVISNTKAKAALPEILIKAISESRGLACSDAVLSIHPTLK